MKRTTSLNPLIKAWVIGITVTILGITLPQAPRAQCAMCKAQVESNSKEGNNEAKGLNAGIMYLMFMPYLLAVGVGVVWYRKYKKKNVPIDIGDEKFHLN